MCKATITATIKWKAEPARSSVHWFSGSTSGTTTWFSNVLVYIPLCITHYLLARWWRWNLVYIPGFKSFFFFILFCCCCFTFCAFICVVLGRFQPKNTTRNMCLFPCWNQSTFKWTELTRSLVSASFGLCFLPLLMTLEHWPSQQHRCFYFLLHFATWFLHCVLAFLAAIL